MHETAGVATIAVAGTLLVLTVLLVRPRIPRVAVDALVALESAAVALGGLMLLDDVGVGMWILTPIVVAALGVVNERALFAGEGPLRT